MAVPQKTGFAAPFPNLPGNNDKRPVPVHGAVGFRRCYFERVLSGGICEIWEYDPISTTSLLLESGPGFSRPAAGYLYDGFSAAPHYRALTFEGTASGVTRVLIEVL